MLFARHSDQRRMYQSIITRTCDKHLMAMTYIQLQHFLDSTAACAIIGREFVGFVNRYAE